MLRFTGGVFSWGLGLGEKERNSGGQWEVFQWEDFWIIGRWDPWAAARMAEKWRHPSLSPRRMSTSNDPEIRQTISNTAKLLSCFTPFGRFGPNILFCQQLWTHNSANPPTVGHGNFVGGSYCIEGLRVVDSYILRTASSVLKLIPPFSLLCSHTCLAVATVASAFLSNIRPKLKYPWLSGINWRAGLWLVIKPPLWLVLMRRPFVEMFTSLSNSSFTLIHFGAVLLHFWCTFIFCLGAPWRTTFHNCFTIDWVQCSVGQHITVVYNPLAIETALDSGQTESEIEELALRCPILPTDGVMMTMTMICSLRLKIWWWFNFEENK